MITARASLKSADAAKFNSRLARARFRLEPNHGLGFRAWARKTYNAFACTGKLEHIVRGKDQR